ncbi:MAG: SGNH/GDSL hydrolase family protein [Clostridiaceae bacterium]|nr:SGNH/GDSL hydrolase family protein [Clostridiaceae bacterium]
MMPFSYRNYVTQLRELVCAKTGSYAFDYSAETLGAAHEQPLIENCVAADSLTLPFHGALVRLQFRLRAQTSHAAVFIDGNPLWEGTLSRADLANPYNLVTLRVPEGEHTLCVQGRGALLYRVECYGGPWAVVNCGVGSCPVGRYLERYYDSYVAPLSPAIVLAEGHTINDWLTAETPTEYEALLGAYLRRVGADGAKAALLTVEPILGRQFSSAGYPFEAYIDASRHAADTQRIPVIDTYAALAEILCSLPEEERGGAWFDDNWHPNAAGHTLYAALSWKLLRNWIE